MDQQTVYDQGLKQNQPGGLTQNNQNFVPQPEEFDIVWFDLAISPDILYRLKPYQRVSQWPGI